MSDLVSQFLEAAPESHRTRLEILRGMIDAALPDAEIVAPNGFPVWTIKEQWVAGLGAPKKGPMLYIMQPGVLDAHDSELGTLRSGRSCVEVRSRRGWTDEDLMDLAERLIDAAAAACATS